MMRIFDYFRFAVTVTGLTPLVLTGQMQPQADSVPLKHWSSPLYWQRPAGKREVANATDPSFFSFAALASPDTDPLNLQFPAGVSRDALIFVAMSPCGLVDTRVSQGFTGPFGPPSIAATPTAGPRSFSPVSAPVCGVPPIAQAYSLSVTAVPLVPGGSLGFVTMYPFGTNPIPTAAALTTQPWIVTNAAIVAAGTNNQVSLIANVPTDLVIDINGYYAAPTDLLSNTALGVQSLVSNTTGASNTAVGDQAGRAKTATKSFKISGSFRVGMKLAVQAHF